MGKEFYMDRRTLLKGIGAVGVVTTGGIVIAQSDDCPADDTLEIDAYYNQDGVLSEEGIEMRGEISPKRDYTMIIKDKNEISRIFDDGISDNLLRQYSSTTTYYIILLQIGASSSMYIDINCIMRERNTVKMSGELKLKSQASGQRDDLATHSLVAAVSDQRDTVPENVEVNIDRGNGHPLVPKFLG